MASEVWYRKWRPQTFADVAGQRHVTDTLARAVAKERVAHAYLFCGPRGTGKTSTARILAKAVNCEQNVDGQPCTHCASCIAVTEGRALDLIEMDAASNRGIDEIRALRDKVGYSPNSSQHKVYLIDEVHELTSFAFDALLKTLEEPPPHVIFVLATTEAHKVPETILSRCQRFDFVRIRLADVVARLRTIAAAEQVTVSDGALALIARRASGSLRDGVSLLEQSVAFHGHELTEDAIRAATGGRGDARAAELVRLLLAADLPGALSLVAEVREDGVEPRRFAADIVDCLRSVLLVRAGAEASLDLAAEDLERLRSLAGSASVAEVLRAARLVSSADFRADPQSPLPLELAIVEQIAGPRTEIERPEAAAQTRTGTPSRTAGDSANGATSAARPQPDPARPGSRAADRIRALPFSTPERPAPTRRVAEPAQSAAPAAPTTAAPVAEAIHPPAATAQNGVATDGVANPDALDRDGADGAAECAAPDGSDAPAAALVVEPGDAGADTGLAVGAAGDGDALEAARRRFRDVYEACKAHNRNAAAVLNSPCDIVEVTAATIVFGFQTQTLADRAAGKAYEPALQNAVREVFGPERRATFVARPDVVSRMEKLAGERPSHLLDEALKLGAKLVR